MRYCVKSVCGMMQGQSWGRLLLTGNGAGRLRPAVGVWVMGDAATVNLALMSYVRWLLNSIVMMACCRLLKSR